MKQYAPRELTTMVKLPRQRPERVGTGKFQFVCTEHRFGFPVGHCAKNKCEHTTPEEASDCFRDWQKENGTAVNDSEYNTILTFTEQ